jgi:hypothetical protein
MHIQRSRAYSQLWRIVDGAVRDALEMHPDYLTQKGSRNARTSVTKRVTGAVLGYAEQAAEGRSGYRPAAEKGGGPDYEVAAGAARTMAASTWRGRLESSPACSFGGVIDSLPACLSPSRDGSD